jgi:hypothetical protein
MPSTINRSPKRLYLIPLTAFLALTLVGAFVAIGCGSSSTDSKAQAIVQKFLEVSQSPDTQSQVMLGKVPDDLPADLPAYPGASLLGSVVTTASGGLKDDSVLRETGDSVGDVYAFYEQAFDTSPWQILASTAQGKIAALQFGNASNPNMAGTVVVQPESSGNGSVIYTSVQTAPAETPTSEPFAPEPSKALPRGWPSQIPVYPNANITDTTWSRSSGSMQWQVSLLAVATPEDIIDYYRTQLSNAGFTVTNNPDQGGVSSLSFENKLTATPWSGTVTAQTFVQDSTYAQAVIQLQIGSGTPQASGTATP